MKDTIKYDYFEQELPDRLAFVDLLAITEFMDDIKGKDLSEVRNTFAWTRTVFMEFLCRRDLLLKDFW